MLSFLRLGLRHHRSRNNLLLLILSILQKDQEMLMNVAIIVILRNICNFFIHYSYIWMVLYVFCYFRTHDDLQLKHLQLVQSTHPPRIITESIKRISSLITPTAFVKVFARSELLHTNSANLSV